MNQFLAAYYQAAYHRETVTTEQMRELRRLGFRGPVGFLYKWEADREIAFLRQDGQTFSDFYNSWRECN